MKKIRVLVVEDSLTVRSRLVATLASDPEIEVVGEAEDGARGIALCTRLRPDVMTLDMVLKNGTGVEVTEHVMAYCPTPIVIVSASFNRGEMLNTYDALAAGALEVIEKPTGKEPDGAWERRFIDTVKIASKIKVITHVRGKLRSTTPLPGTLSALAHSPPTTEREPVSPSRRGSMITPRPPAPAAIHAEGSRRYTCVAMGASTGGPGAVVRILRELQPPLPLPVLLVIHLGQPFGQAFADWLNQMVPVPVAEARQGEPLPPPGVGRVLMAPPDRHLFVEGGRLCLSEGPERHSCRPSVDVLFESVARELGPSAIGCLLTGMGKDGATGLLEMKRAGAMTLAQDEPTSVVFGMPREAIRLGAASRILPLGDFAKTLLALSGAPQSREGSR
ncbi:chemotaxis-specific protein-glutamate methyltransferase CheB [Polyangium aurulentum]|uniref:chemotaxis-specific protein-glutamate methyltransferase CheB n=1 Tax=Polyangium aurulentum TaxID=2567896 RepID=UPI0010AE5B88|nr:chemotaxis-specific protein-glutamate methyltransferase CheB [Polyangium aurulentum]UQA60741.1 chemotaxis-specific protein-glutamate methyltransferase CheB [Polyangium aurulentum]